MLKRLTLSYVLIIGVVFTTLAQDIHFSQFYMSPLNLNPAMTGVLNCKNRFAANYRNQWAGVLGGNAYNTYSLSYDQKNTVGRDDYFGLGGTLWGDVAGETRYGMIQARVSGSYSKKMFGKRKSASYAVVGADLGVTQRSIGQGDLRWPSQITTNGFDPTQAGEVLQDYTRYYPDLSLGLLWFTIKDDNNYWYLGGAVHHLNAPDISFSGINASLYRRLTVHGGGEFLVTQSMSVKPFGLFMAQGPHKEFNGGASLKFLLGNARQSDQSFELGAYYRLGVQASPDPGDNSTGLHSDAIIFQTKFNSGQASYGFTYDLNISKLASGKTGNGSFEFSVMYQICGPESRGVYCPRF